MHGWTRLRKLFSSAGAQDSPDYEQSLDAELRDHLDRQVEAYIARGMSPVEARRQANVDFGGEAQIKEECRDVYAWRFLTALGRDMKYALRSLRKSPMFTTIAVLVLAVGIGANATMFTIANAYLFQSLPFADSERVVYITSTSTSNPSARGRGVSYPDYQDFQKQTQSFQSMGLFARAEIDLSDDSGAYPLQYRAARLSPNAFSVIGQKPVLGRDFLPEDGRADAPPVVILSHSLWQTRYGGDGSILGSTIRINAAPATVVGVMGPGLRFPVDSALWMPLVPTADWKRREVRNLTMFGRLAAGVPLAAAQAEMSGIAASLARAYPKTNSSTGILVRPYNDYVTGRNTRLTLLALLGAVGFVLLIACANVANLLLARAVGRSREVSIRVALGAGRWQVIRQLLVESVMLSCAGAALGLLLGQWGVRIFEATLIAEERPSYLTFAMDSQVLAYLAAITIGTGILFGLAPALRLSRLDVSEVLKDASRTATAGWRGRRLSSLLVVVEMSLAFVLLAGAGLMIRSLWNMTAVPVGARTDHLMSMAVVLRASKYPTPAAQLAFHDQLKTRLEAVPGVEMVAMASNFPGDGWTRFSFELEGAPPLDPSRRPRTGGVIVSPSYFEALDIGPVRGRVFSDSDGSNGVPAVVVNQSFANAAWPGKDALGKRLRLFPRIPSGTSASVAQPWLTVVGVIPDVLQDDESQGAHDPLVYLPYRYMQLREMVVATRTLIPPERVAGAFRREVQSLDPDLAVIDVRTLDALLRERTWTWRIYGGMFSIFAGIALVLASVSLYAVRSHSVSQRTQEIGVRMALGASKRDVLRIVLLQGLRQIGIGMLVGSVAAFGVTRILDSLLVGVDPIDPVTFISVALILALTGLLGSVLPALRAAQVDPAIALRYE